MYNEKSRVRSGDYNGIRNFYSEPKQEEEKNLDFHEKKNSGMGKINKLLSGDGLPSMTASFSDALSNLKDDDVLLLLMIFLLFNENRQDDYLVLVVLGALLFA